MGVGGGERRDYIHLTADTQPPNSLTRPHTDSLNPELDLDQVHLPIGIVALALTHTDVHAPTLTRTGVFLGVAPMEDGDVDAFKDTIVSELGWQVEDVTADEACDML